jgi:F-type H+-transporting ATPase subunit c
MLNEAKLIGAGLATLGIGAVGIGIGNIFGSLLLSVSRNPSLKNDLTGIAMLGFALTESIALFGLMITFLLLFGF